MHSKQWYIVYLDFKRENKGVGAGERERAK